jgi:hypothetical protein
MDRKYVEELNRKHQKDTEAENKKKFDKMMKLRQINKEREDQATE